jgi:hypothetical protein
MMGAFLAFLGAMVFVLMLSHEPVHSERFLTCPVIRQL